MRNATRKERGRPAKEVDPKNIRGARLLYAIVKAGYTQQSFARAVEISGGALNKIIHDPNARTTMWGTFARKLNVPAEWLEFGVKKTCVQIIQGDQIREIKTNEDGPPFNLGTPWYEWQQAQLKTINVESLPRKQFITGGSYRTMALVIDETINISPDSNVKDFHPGDIIYIDPEIEPQENNMVLAHVRGEKHCILRQYVKAHGKWWLKPLNPQFPAIPLSDKIEIIGVYYATLRYDESFYSRRKRDLPFKNPSKSKKS
jgi:hypothetical protein